jgi:hypothetical protein
MADQAEETNVNKSSSKKRKMVDSDDGDDDDDDDDDNGSIQGSVTSRGRGGTYTVLTYFVVI